MSNKNPSLAIAFNTKRLSAKKRMAKGPTKSDSATEMDTADSAKKTPAMAQLHQGRTPGPGKPEQTNFKNQGAPSDISHITDEELKMEMRKRMAAGGWVDDTWSKQAGEGMPTHDDDSDWLSDTGLDESQEQNPQPYRTRQRADAQDIKYKPQQKFDGGMVTDERDDKNSIAAAVMLKRKKMAEGGMVDMEANSEESGNTEDDLNWDAIKKEQYDDDQLSATPQDGEDGDDEEKEAENKNDKVGQIRARMKAKRG